MTAIQFIPFTFPGIEKVSCVFTTRLGGYSKDQYTSANISFDVGDLPENVQTNRDKIMSLIGLSSVHELRQLHGSQMVVSSDSSSDYKELPEGDAIITDLDNQGLMIKTADCQPILLTDISGNFIAALHVGWRGNRDKALLKWVEQICKQYQVPPKEVLAVRGPSLGPAKSQFVNFFKEWPEEFLPYFNKTEKTVDLWLLTRDQLLTAGMIPEHICQIDLCTYSLPNLFFSYRRDRNCGRQAAIIWKTPKSY